MFLSITDNLKIIVSFNGDNAERNNKIPNIKSDNNEISPRISDKTTKVRV
jgi:hypothetical protein